MQKSLSLYCVGSTPAVQYAAARLAQKGIPLIDHPSPDITHLLLDIPSFRADGLLRSGQPLRSLLDTLPGDITLIGGNLQNISYNIIDLLKDPEYIAKNAAITAHCALKIAADKLPCTFEGLPVLIIGWGRIGKCLAKKLQALGAAVTVAARKPEDRAILEALGFRAISPDCIHPEQFRLIYNTAPAAVLKAASDSGCCMIDLASEPGIEGDHVIWARGLPGIHAPESSGDLIAETILRLLKEEKT